MPLSEIYSIVSSCVSLEVLRQPLRYPGVADSLRELYSFDTIGLGKHFPLQSFHCTYPAPLWKDFNGPAVAVQ